MIFMLAPAEVRDKVVAEGLNAGYAYAEKHPHPRLWKLLATAALEEMDLVSSAVIL